LTAIPGKIVYGASEVVCEGEVGTERRKETDRVKKLKFAVVLICKNG
jgi:hypothetical protein